MFSEVTEFFVKGRKNPYLPLIITGIIAGLFLFNFLMIKFLGIIGITLMVVLTAFGIYCIRFLILYNKIEYEYSVMSNDFEINEIRNQTKRTPLIKCHIGDMQGVKKILSKEFDEKNDRKCENTEYLYCFGEDDEILYSFTVRGEDGINKVVYIAHVDTIMNKLSVQNFEFRKLV